ncbi:MAG: hypothetical protein ACE5E5_13635 [Phycisphaerae bacterium]
MNAEQDGPGPTPAGGLPSVNIRLVAKDAFSFGPEEITTQPTSENVSFLAGSVFNLEIWAQTDDPGGLSAVSLDVHFDPGAVIVTGNNNFPFSEGIFHGFVFTSLTHGTANNVTGTVEDISGAYIPGGGCMADPTAVGPLNWSRVAVVEMQAVADTTPTIAASGTGNPVFGTAVCGMGNSPESSIHYTGINTNTADLNGDSAIDLLDHAFFLSCQSAPSGGPIDPSCGAADSDSDGDVDLNDWGWFQTHFQ